MECRTTAPTSRGPRRHFTRRFVISNISSRRIANCYSDSLSNICSCKPTRPCSVPYCNMLSTRSNLHVACTRVSADSPHAQHRVRRSDRPQRVSETPAGSARAQLSGWATALSKALDRILTAVCLLHFPPRSSPPYHTPETACDCSFSGLNTVQMAHRHWHKALQKLCCHVVVTLWARASFPTPSRLVRVWPVPILMLCWLPYMPKVLSQRAQWNQSAS